MAIYSLCDDLQAGPVLEHGKKHWNAEFLLKSVSVKNMGQLHFLQIPLLLLEGGVKLMAKGSPGTPGAAVTLGNPSRRQRQLL